MKEVASKIINRRSKILQALDEDILGYIQELGIDDVRRYMEAFPNEPDFNIANYGNALICNADVRNLFIRCGNSNCAEKYKISRGLNNVGDYRISDDELWLMYRKEVGEVARMFSEYCEHELMR